VIAVIVATSIGAAIPFLPGEPVILLFGLAILPFLFVLARDRPVVAFGAFLGVQFMEAFELQTPVGTFSIGIVLLGLLLAVHGPRVHAAITESRPVAIATACLFAWLLLHLLRFSYADAPAEVFRQVIKDGSFVATFLLAAAFAREPKAWQAAGIGATVSLLVLGGCGILVGLGQLPAPDRIEPPRPLLGVTSPFDRNYGLSVPYDAVALLGPVCLPFLTFTALQGRIRQRIPAIVALGSLIMIILFVFQARGLLLQAAVCLAVALAFRTPKMAVVAALCCIPLIVSGLSTLSNDRRPNYDRTVISTQLRTATLGYVVRELAADPERFLSGRDEKRVYLTALEQAPNPLLLTVAANQDDEVHNLFLGELVAGGYLAFLAILVPFVLAARQAIRSLRFERSFRSEVGFTALILMAIALSIEPGTANIVGCWVALGLILAAPVPRPGAATSPSALQMADRHPRPAYVRPLGAGGARPSRLMGRHPTP
jgi:hypothetical protein